MDFYRVIEKRQSVRCYRADPLPASTLKRILGAFQRAPSWANTQPWEIVLVFDGNIKKELQSTLTASNPARHAVVDAPVLACMIGILGKSGSYKGKTVTSRGDSWVMFDMGIAAEHLALAAAAEGLGTVHIGLFDEKKAGQILGIPGDRTVIELIPLGFPDHMPERVHRKPLFDFVFKDRYAQPYSSDK